MKKNLGFTKEKIKNICLKLFNLGKKHKVLSTFLCLLIIVFCFKSVVWVYNDMAYGRFVKVGEKHFDDIRYSSLYETDYGTIQFFIPSYNPYPDGIQTETYFKRIGDFLVFYKFDTKAEFEIYNKDKDFVFYKKGNNGLYYNLIENEKELKLISDVNKHNLNISPIIRYNNRSININGNNIEINPEKTNGVGTIANLDTENIVLIFCNPRYGKTFEYSYRYSVKHNKLYKLDVSEIPCLSGTYNKLIHIKDNKFIYLQNDKNYGHLISVALFTLKNDKFKKHELKLPKNSNRYGFSTDNPLILNENQVLFVGGAKGYLVFERPTKQCYLYDIQKNKITRVNDFPFRINETRILKTKMGEFYISAIAYSRNYHIIHYIYKYNKI